MWNQRDEKTITVHTWNTPQSNCKCYLNFLISFGDPYQVNNTFCYKWMEFVSVVSIYRYICIHLYVDLYPCLCAIYIYRYIWLSFTSQNWMPYLSFRFAIISAFTSERSKRFTVVNWVIHYWKTWGKLIDSFIYLLIS